MMIHMTMNHRTAKPGTTQPPRSGDTTKAAQRPGNETKDESGGEQETKRAACSADAERSARAGQETIRRSRRGETKRRTRRSANRETRRARGEAPSPLHMPVQPLPPPVCSTVLPIFHTGSTATAGPTQRTTYRRRGGMIGIGVAGSQTSGLPRKEDHLYGLATVLTYCPFSMLITSPTRNLRQSALAIFCRVSSPLSRLM